MLSFIYVPVAVALGILTAYFSYWPLLGIVFFGLFVLALISPEKALFGLIFYLPFQVALNAAPGIDLASIRILILVLFLAWLLRSFVRGKLELGFGRAGFALAAFLALAALSLFWAENLIWGARKFALLASVFPLYFLTAAAIQNKQNAEKAVFFLIVGSAIISFIALVQFFAQFLVDPERLTAFWAGQLAPLFYGQTFSQAVLSNSSWLVNIGGRTYFRAISLFPDPHMLAFYLEMTLPFVFSALLAKFRPAVFFAFCLMTAALLLTFSRGGYFGLLAGFLAVLAFFWPNLKEKSKPILAPLFIFSTLILFVFAAPAAERFLASFSLAEGSNALRIETWRQAAEVISSAPLLGVGLGNYALAANPKADYRDPIYAHNTYLDVWAELGLIGLLIWLAIIGGAVLFVFKKIKETGPAAISSGIFGAMAAFSAHSFFETAIFSPVILSLLMIVLGLAARAGSASKISNS